MKNKLKMVNETAVVRSNQIDRWLNCDLLFDKKIDIVLFHILVQFFHIANGMPTQKSFLMNASLKFCQVT